MTGIIISYLIIVSVFLYIVIGVKKKWLLKTVCVLAFVYYSIGLAYSINSFMGWPTSVSIPDNSRLIWVQIHEPDYIYLWIQTDFLDEDILRLDPRDVFQYIGNDEPRLYKIPYTKEEHRKIIKAMKDKMESKGSQIVTKKGNKKGKQGQGFKEARNLEYKILNPYTFLPK